MVFNFKLPKNHFEKRKKNLANVNTKYVTNSDEKSGEKIWAHTPKKLTMMQINCNFCQSHGGEKL